MSVKETNFLKWLAGILLTTLVPFSLLGVTNMIQMRPLLKAATEDITEVKVEIDSKLDEATFILYLQSEKEKSVIMERALQSHMKYDAENFQRLFNELSEQNKRIDNLHRTIRQQ